MPTQEQHPIEYLFNEQKKIAPDQNGKVIPVQEMIAQIAFFPGGSGLWLGKSRSWNVTSDRPPMPKKKIMVLGNDFGPKSWYEKCLRQYDHDLNCATWWNLLPLLKKVGIQPKDCFFTNAYMGLRLEEKSTGQSPGAADPEFVERCWSFLALQIAIQKPHLILALGEYPIKSIAGLSPDLVTWRRWQGFKKLDASGPLKNRVRFKGAPEQSATVVALVHSSYRQVNVKHRRYGGLTGEAAELAMLKAALKQSGLY